jgi:hypothetical protein
MVIRDYYAGVQQALGNPFVRTNRRISTLTNGANPSWDRPDIVDFGNVPALVYEIKPRGSEPVATTEALDYIAQLGAGGVPAILGPTERPGTSAALNIGYATIYFSSVSPGTIRYDWVWDPGAKAAVVKVTAAAVFTLLGAVEALAPAAAAP